MSTHARSPAAAWSWLKQAVNLGRRNPRAVFGAVALLALVALLPSLVQLLLSGLGLGATAMMGVMAACTLVMVVLYPLLIGGVLRVIDAAEHGRPTHASALFDTFRAGPDRNRLVGFGVVMFLAYLVVFVAVVGLFGGDEVAAWYAQLLTASTQSDPAAQAQLLQEVPAGFGTMMALGTLAGLFFGGVYAIGFGQVALGGRGVGAALADGVAGTLKNLLPIGVLAVMAFVGFFIFALVAGLAILLLAGIGGLVHPMLAALLATPVYFAALLALYVVMFGVMYFMWRDVCGGQAPPLPPDRLEL